MGINPFSRVQRHPPPRRARRRSPQALLVLGLLVAIAAPCGRAAAQTVGEYPLKAGYLYNFALLTEWPAHAAAPAGAPFAVCIVGDDPFGAAIDAVAGRDIEGRRIAVHRFAAGASAGELAACRLLFLAPSAEAHEAEVLARLAALPVLTVSDAAGFVDRGGMVGFVIRSQRLRFEINRRAAAAVGMSFRSKLLRLADRVVGE